jgi:hypothetical protein
MLDFDDRDLLASTEKAHDIGSRGVSDTGRPGPVNEDPFTRRLSWPASVELLGPTSEDAMVLAFLRAEIDSPLVGATLAWCLVQHKADRSLLDQPDLRSQPQNELRKRVLGSSRGYAQDAYLFGGFPDNVGWNKARLTVAELGSAKYAYEQSWSDLTGGSRRISDGAKVVGVQLPGDTPRFIRDIADAICTGRRVSDLVLVGRPGAEPADLVLVEGFKRATALVSVGRSSDTVDVFLGFSERIGDWPRF